MPKTKFKKSKCRVADLMLDDRMKIGGKMYRVVSTEPNTFGRDNIAIYFRPLNIESARYADLRLSMPPPCSRSASTTRSSSKPSP